jgi:hypothetical protein
MERHIKKESLRTKQNIEQQKTKNTSETKVFFVLLSDILISMKEGPPQVPIPPESSRQDDLKVDSPLKAKRQSIDILTEYNKRQRDLRRQKEAARSRNKN